MNTKCEQKCGSDATVYAGHSFRRGAAGGWAGYYCFACQVQLGFTVWHVIKHFEPTPAVLIVESEGANG